MQPPTFVTLSDVKPTPFPATASGEHDVRTPPAPVGHVLDRFTDPGDVAFDPFAGEVVVGWEAAEDTAREGAYGYGDDHSYCLVFEA